MKKFRIIFVLLPSITLSFHPWHADAVERPNIVLILADDLGWSDLGCYGSDTHQTPNIDQLASEGVRFTNAYSASPVCTPTRASIMTGKHPARLHMTIWHESAINRVMNRPLIPPDAEPNLSMDEVTLAEVLKDAGYYTAHIGKWHLGTAGHYPEAHGFDLNIGGTFWGAPQTFYYPYIGTEHYRGEYRYVPGLEPGEPGDHLTDRLTDKALEVIDRVSDRPFFLNMWYHTPHTPIEGKPEDAERYRRNIKPDAIHRNPHYAAMMHSLDENVGRILSKIENHGLTENTIVLFLSDNGGYIGRWNGQVTTNNSPLRSGKGSLYEGGIRIPWIVKWPGNSPRNKVCETPVFTCDLYPTLLSILGLQGQPEHNKTVDGVDISSLFKQPDATITNRALFFHYPHYYSTTTPVSSIRSGHWKLLHYHTEDKLELFDLRNDLAEKFDLSGAMLSQASQLLDRLTSWRSEVHAQMPTRNP